MRLKINKKIIFVLSVVFFIAATAMGLWKIPFICKINILNIPKECEMVHPTKAEYTDVYIPHILCEKVVKCDKGWEYVKQYIEDNNINLKNITICNYFDITDDAIYFGEVELDDVPIENRNKYAKIRYSSWD